jgi:fatty-acyl-CoA synthase
MYHANAWGLPLAATMLGCKLVFAGPHTDASGLIDLFASQKVTLSAAVPTIWLDVLRELEKNSSGRKLGPLRGVVSGAAPPVSLIRALDKHGISLVQAWGLIETAPLATFCSIAPRLQQAGEAERYAIRATQGRPMPFVDFRALGENGPIPWDGVTLGEAQLRGPWVASSYYNQPDLRIKWTEDGWFRTGDVVTIDANGYMKIADRAKDLIRFGDDWISSVDLENQLMGHPAVKEAAVIAVQHPEWQERPLAAIVLKPDEHASADDLRSFLGEKFAAWQLPEAFVFLPELPHTPTGKLLKKELRKRFKNYHWEKSPAR